MWNKEEFLYYLEKAYMITDKNDYMLNRDDIGDAGLE
jgi:hypothetical protein